MKTKTVLVTVITLCLMVGGVGCKKDNLPEFYTGTVTMLGINDGNMQKNIAIIQIQKSIPDGLPINQRIAVDQGSLIKDIKSGDTLNFTIIQLSGWQHTAGLFPDLYIPFAEIKLYNQ